MIDTRVKKKEPSDREYVEVGGEGIGGCFAQVTLKVAHTPVGNLNFGQFSSRPAGLRWWVGDGSVLVLRRNRLWEPISPGYGSRGAVAALFHPFSYYTRPCIARRVGGSTLTVPPPSVYPTSFCSIARNPMKFQCGAPSPLLGYVLPRITPLDFGEGGGPRRKSRRGLIINRPN